ncbi:Zn-dependent hydrolase, beta-lactamase superfamily [Weissella ceti]|uniref:Zn-dependent hydrolase, beta-lactamase superfamily n=3 Tax=Lactobacillaceae TaxID=33958 RepID=A0A075TTZ8_9LACO|nr:Zn-dependent hydrolase, beta-lactamase superfamily [Weissella tructae]AIM62306.1 Zn-dependent hydrolase, beta-lactamase superfamily [Weissella ceti]AIM63645.1 Zn-dependent hydrolase, beta-lactamase superfamily [Weissella ceti]ELA07814.1 zinc-dependent hydrolase [Weissella ceti NC36]
MSDFKASMLASSSTGNVTYVETPGRKVLLDAGLSGKKIEGLMQEVDRSLADVDSIFVSHEHSDHIAGVGILSRKYDMDIYANEETWAAMAPKIGKIAPEHIKICRPGEVIDLGDLEVESYSVSHDAANPQFYSFHHANKTFAALTDTGYVNDRMLSSLRNADALLFESNHDYEMLRMGSYAWSLKQRILGDKGHLSNEDGALALAEVIGSRTKNVFLGHLSQENNQQELAYLTVKGILEAKDFAVNHDFLMHNTEPLSASRLIDI